MWSRLALNKRYDHIFGSIAIYAMFSNPAKDDAKNIIRKTLSFVFSETALQSFMTSPLSSSFLKSKNLLSKYLEKK